VLIKAQKRFPILHTPL